MIYVRKAEERGHANHGWLDSWHTFSFASYHDANFMGFSALRVINEDVIDGGQGFGTHPHKDMEILTYVLSGTVEHQDSMGNKEQIPAGEFQIMSAGTGVRHSEYNASESEPLHLYQIWIIPERTGIEPRYDQRRFPDVQGRQLVLSPDAREGSLKVFQDMTLSRWVMAAGEQDNVAIDAGRRIWIQVVKGDVTVNGNAITTSDALAIWDESALTIEASSAAEVLLFDLPPV
ncbi:pirin family protein [Pantoea agglomerans]|jgi:redox-sensitive bicupin YhaK (pirin superfamily)|uniref:Cupin domain-containing protein n=3 Tax=Pantoea TaxID=53335 RepID=A0A7X2MM54_ENTAG|nr:MULTISPECIES: pirin family protein [Pantoea]MDF9908333.1 redox-sensitive bicupin YhaK (pirin superfamily) [Pantoea brenneri]AOE39345.1 quercetin 2,3-dioxygenase [Pantoea agglomerans]AZI52578.1 pirin family protein [Pantoea agglomerans]ERM10672.1 quercetin 2,3-dioxygenase [Pantoea agglomerans Tx10]EZI35125.1 Quercetin 2,3-dioxygenase [Pantoea agglomerans]